VHNHQQFSSTAHIERENGGFFKRVLKKVGFAENSKAVSSGY
jgi:hypothetical protein